MQKIYIFHDTDPAGKEEYDISGNAFHTLLAACCRYCTILTLRFPQQVPAAEALEPYRIPNDERLPLDIVYAHYGTLSFGEVRSYRVCPELIALFSIVADSMFKWLWGCGYAHPEDPVFYRADGSVFFCSCIHEGECMLLPRDDEDVGKILADPLWRTCEINAQNLPHWLTIFTRTADAQERNRLAIQFADHCIDEAIPYIVDAIKTHEQIGSLIYALRCYPTIPTSYLADFVSIVANGRFEAAHESYLLIAQSAGRIEANTRSALCAALRRFCANGCQNHELAADLLDELDVASP